MPPPTLAETPRLRIRQLGAEDLPALKRIYGDVEAMRWIGDGEALAEADAERWIEVTLANYTKRGYGMSVIERLSDERRLGFCGLVHPGGQAEVEIKYALDRDAWGQGFATEAVRAMLEYGLREHGIRSCIATVAPENAASHRVLEKAGFQRAETRVNEDDSITLVFRHETTNS